MRVKKMLMVTLVLCLVPVGLVTAQQGDLDYRELVGTWVYTEYDGLFHNYEQITWRSDGTTTCFSNSPDLRSFSGASTIAEKWMGQDGSTFAKVILQTGNDSCYMLLKIGASGDWYEVAFSTDSPDFPGRIDPGSFHYRFYYRL